MRAFLKPSNPTSIHPNPRSPSEMVPADLLLLQHPFNHLGLGFRTVADACILFRPKLLPLDQGEAYLQKYSNQDHQALFEATHPVALKLLVLCPPDRQSNTGWPARWNYPKISSRACGTYGWLTAQYIRMKIGGQREKHSGDLYMGSNFVLAFRYSSLLD